MVAQEVSPEEVRHVANLARLAMSDEDLERIRHELNRIMKFFAQLQELDTDDVPETSHAIPMTDVYRDDEVRPSLPPDKITQNAPDGVEEFFRVPGFMEEESS